MLDLLIDLMASVSAMEKANAKENKLRQIQECTYALKAIENRLQKIKQETQQAGPGDSHLD